MLSPATRSAIVGALRNGSPLDYAAHGAGVSLATLRREEAGDVGLALELSIAARPLAAPPKPRRAVVVIGAPYLVLLVGSAGLVVHAGPLRSVAGLLGSHDPSLVTFAYPWSTPHHEGDHEGDHTEHADNFAAYLPIWTALYSDVRIRFAPLAASLPGAIAATPVERLRAAVERPLDDTASCDGGPVTCSYCKDYLPRDPRRQRPAAPGFLARVLTSRRPDVQTPGR